MTARLLIYAIYFYKRFISPHKPSGCAFRISTGRASCSTLGLRAVRRYGALAGLVLIRKRTQKCGIAYRRYILGATPTSDLPCSLPCDSCSPDFGDLSQGCDGAASCCDWPFGKKDKKKRRQEDDTHLPPERR